MTSSSAKAEAAHLARALKNAWGRLRYEARREEENVDSAYEHGMAVARKELRQEFVAERNIAAVQLGDLRAQAEAAVQAERQASEAKAAAVKAEADRAIAAQQQAAASERKAASEREAQLLAGPLVVADLAA